jgi:RHS repeat-associated protein
VKPCDDKDLPDWLDRLDLGRSFGFDFDGHHYGRHFARLLNPFTFQGRRFDGFSQTFNHRNRQYKPKYGRWLTKDPISFEGGLNLYNYVNNNPLVYTDPFGESIQAAIDMLKAHSDTVSWGQKLATAYATKNPTEIIKAFFSIQTELGKCAIDESNLNSIRFEIVTDELWTSPDVGYDQVWGLKFWSPADFGSSLNYALYHYIKHGKEVGAKDFSDYLDKTNSARLNVSGEPTRIDSPTFGEIYKYKLKNGKYITLTWDGQIVSYGNQ